MQKLSSQTNYKLLYGEGIGYRYTPQHSCLDTQIIHKLERELGISFNNIHLIKLRDALSTTSHHENAFDPINYNM